MIALRLRITRFFISMAKTKAQKSDILTKGRKELKNSTNLIFADFSGTTSQDLRALRLTLKETGAKFQVIKKRLLRILLKEMSLELDPKEFETQLGTISAKGDIFETAGLVYKFAKGKENFKILGGIDLSKAEKMEADFIKKIGQLPSREVLLGQVLGTIVAPLRAFMWILSQKSLSAGRKVEKVK